MAAASAERMKAMRARRRAGGLRELRLIVPDVRSKAFRSQIAAQAAALDPKVEEEALDFIEAVADFDETR
jgi:hypothetical protein